MELNYTIYTKPKCTFCDKVKELLKDTKDPIWIDCSSYLTPETSKQLFLQFIKDTAKIPEQYKTFPMVFCNGRFVGGYIETQLFHERNTFIQRDF